MRLIPRDYRLIRQLKHLPQLQKRDVFFNIKLEKMINFWAAPVRDSKTKKLRLILLDYERVNIWCVAAPPRSYKLLINFLFHFIHLIFCCLQLVFDLVRFSISIDSINVSFFEVNLFVGNLILAAFSIHEGFIHAIFVV